MPGAPAFIVECYWPGATADDFRRATERLAAAVDEHAARGIDVVLVHSTYVPADEAAHWVVRAPHAEIVADAFAAADLNYQRLLPALDSTSP